MLVKVCGVCRPLDAEAVADAGADCIGVILSPGFSRSRDAAAALAIFSAAGPVRRVGVFVDAGTSEIRAAADRLSLATAQLHGGESPEFARDLREGGLAVWKAIRPRSADDLLLQAARFESAVDALLLDGAAPGVAGGTGARFDWPALAGVRERLQGVTLLVAGGLTPENVGEAIRVLRPDGVDVSSGVETAPGEKSPQAIRAFVAAARAAADRNTARERNDHRDG